jgi:predicted  nucleic acid-binding Zn-ribbon protein
MKESSRKMIGVLKQMMISFHEAIPELN